MRGTGSLSPGGLRDVGARSSTAIAEVDACSFDSIIKLVEVEPNWGRHPTRSQNTKHYSYWIYGGYMRPVGKLGRVEYSWKLTRAYAQILIPRFKSADLIDRPA